MKRKHILTLILASFFVVVSFYGMDVNAQTSISGDTLCGSSVATKCGVDDIATIFKKIFSTIIALGLPLLVIFIMYRFVVAYYQLAQGNANAYKEAIGKVTQAIIGFIIIVALFGGILLVMLKYLGVKDFPLELLKKLSEAFIPHAYALEQLPNPLGVTSLYDFILNALSLVLKFFIYPALITIWVWTGFSYVFAQGAPEKLMKAHKLLMWAFISTLVVFVTQGFLIALRGSVEKIVPSSSMVIPVSKFTNKDDIKFINKII